MRIAVVVTTAMAIATSCTHVGRVVDNHDLKGRHDSDLSREMVCATAGLRRWKMFEYRHDGYSYLYLEQQVMQPDGSWRALGGAGFDSTSEGVVRRKLEKLECSADGAGVKAKAYARASDPEQSYNVVIHVSADYVLESDIVVLG
jgi:hypothetical protein